MKCTARAPGKLILLGEYAVLDGVPCVVAAIDRFVEASVTAGRSAGRVEVHAPQLCERMEFSAEDDSLPDGSLRFVMAAFQAAAKRAPALRKGAVSIETRDELRSADGTKFGLGGSAAVTVAALAALLGWAEESSGESTATPRDVTGAHGERWRSEILSAALEAHGRAQSVAGSGADLAASVYGGLTKFARCGAEPPSVSRVSVPASFHLLAGWSAEAASTGSQVARYLAATGGAVRRKFCDETAACVERFVTALTAGTVLSDAFDANDSALRELEVGLGLTLHTPKLNQLIAAARHAGAGAKMSGAGGGDCGIAVTDDASVAARVRESWLAVGITPLDLSIVPAGVSLR